MSTEFPNKNNKRRRYRTRMFDDRFSFPTTSEQVRQLQAESDAQGRSVASLIREAIDEFLPRLRGRRRKRERPLTGNLRAGPRLASRKGPCCGSWASRKSAQRGSGAMAPKVLCESILSPGFGATLKRKKAVTSWI